MQKCACSMHTPLVRWVGRGSVKGGVGGGMCVGVGICVCVCEACGDTCVGGVGR